MDAIIRSGAVGYPDAAWALCEMLDALARLHDAGIVHRDIKPENLLLQRRADGGRRLRLIDLGVAKFLDADLASPRLTQTGTLVGTPHYIAPEVLLGQRADERADMLGGTYNSNLSFIQAITEAVAGVPSAMLCPRGATGGWGRRRRDSGYALGDSETPAVGEPSSKRLQIGD